MKETHEILNKILLPLNSSWTVSEVKVDKKKEEIDVVLTYNQSHIEVDGNCYGIYDHRPARRWRHLDLWQYKTYITADIPRYKDEKGFYHSVKIPWAEACERMTILLEKKF